MTWYCAHIMVTTRLPDGGQDDVGPVDERIFLIEADDMPAAREAAVAIGEAEEAADAEALKRDNKSTMARFLGVREIRKLSDAVPGHGTKLTHSSFEVADHKSARRLALGESVAVTYNSASDYVIDASEDVSERAEQYSKLSESRGPLVSVRLCLHGSDLDPDQITRILNTEPTHQHRKNDTHRTVSGQTVTRKGGLWKILVQIDSPEVSDHLEALAEEVVPLLKIVREQGLALNTLPNVEHAYVDIFRVQSAMWEQTFMLLPENARFLAELGLPVKITVAY